MTRYVLVPGACHGGWLFEPVAAALRAAGHERWRGSRHPQPHARGIGAVEVTMVAALVAAGVHGPHAITAVLVYWAISLKGAVTILALFYRYLHDRRQRVLPS